MPTETCNIHGEPRAPVVAEAPSAEVPRAQLAANLTDVKPVILKSPTLLAENDPYNSTKSVTKIDDDEQDAEKETAQKVDNRPPVVTAAEVPNQKTNKANSADDGKPILKAIPVQPQPKETPLEIRRAIPVGPMDEVEEGTLLKAAVPSPTRSDDE
jgi:hypothetical protein